ncbi:hypothetical protein MBLNU13_g05776t1 [Cladosporium sp. NU13]
MAHCFARNIVALDHGGLAQRSWIPLDFDPPSPVWDSRPGSPYPPSPFPASWSVTLVPGMPGEPGIASRPLAQSPEEEERKNTEKREKKQKEKKQKGEEKKHQPVVVDAAVGVQRKAEGME